MARKWEIVRFRDDEPEMRCRKCSEYWPVTVEFWNPDRGTAVCRACHAEVSRQRRIRDRRTDAALDRKRIRDRTYFARMMADPATAELVKARRQAASRRYYERHRLEILARRRAAYADALDRPMKTNMGRRRVAA